MSHTNSTALPAANHALVELQPELKTLTPQQADQAHGGLLPAVQPSPLLPAVQSSYLAPSTVAGAFDTFRS